MGVCMSAVKRIAGHVGCVMVCVLCVVGLYALLGMAGVSIGSRDMLTESFTSVVKWIVK